MKLNAPGAGELAQSERPFALMLRSESLPDLPWLADATPLIEQGGYLLYVLMPGPDPAP